MKNNKPNLKSAYALETVEDNLELYANWASDYENDFASKMDYILPNQVAQIFSDMRGKGPVLDVGAGTGLGGLALAKLGIGPIDAMDLSDAMLNIASKKKVYRYLFSSDITQPLKTGNSYKGIISSGTFTHGHVGPNAIDNILKVAIEGAFFAVSVNKKHWIEKGFSEKFDAIKDNIDELTLHDVDIYGKNSKGEHSNDKGIVATFLKI